MLLLGSSKESPYRYGERLVKVTRKIAIAHDVTWPDLPTASTQTMSYIYQIQVVKLMSNLSPLMRKRLSNLSLMKITNLMVMKILMKILMVMKNFRMVGRRFGLVTMVVVLADLQLHLRGFCRTSVANLGGISSSCEFIISIS